MTGPVAGSAWRTVSMSHHQSLENCIELFCRKGCRALLRDIQAMEQGEIPPEAAHLDVDARVELLAELKAVMAVYQRPCDIN